MSSHDDDVGGGPCNIDQSPSGLVSRRPFAPTGRSIRFSDFVLPISTFPPRGVTHVVPQGYSFGCPPGRYEFAVFRIAPNPSPSTPKESKRFRPTPSGQRLSKHEQRKASEEKAKQKAEFEETRYFGLDETKPFAVKDGFVAFTMHFKYLGSGAFFF
ncbi:hypothetical protein THAOC_07332 [Thalassiosira oceanica]|uniref:Uncharacterized protein n=1 Tax=Thalassiosira oceanica TaxID=159749 RepID=K0T0M6_THAOC|nr:hypothetical protein THAOC_07332 [Thalassiosira oceanica]|eukprot:EJK71250.1 hypothetical protein THAOC_07332 [Thalassiosira oceanica]